MEQVEIYINKHPDKFRTIFYQLRNIILETSPKIAEKFSYQCPFYYYKKPFCYTYTSKKKPNKVLFGFCQGAKLSNEHGLLTATDRKHIRLIELDVNKVPNWKVIREVINEGVILQDVLYK